MITVNLYYHEKSTCYWVELAGGLGASPQVRHINLLDHLA